MIIALGNDHRGFALKQFLLTIDAFGAMPVTWLDVGSFSQERTDYPIYAGHAIKLIQEKKAKAAVLACGTGTGMAIAANRFKHIYAGVAWNPEVARLNKTDDNVNILILPADFIKPEEAREIIQAWLSAEFKGGRYAERIAMLDNC